MSVRKSQKPELIAIYRLEFYKKQNKWKLSSSRKEKKSTEKSTEKSSENKKNLNITYNVDHTDSEEQSDPLNVAFVDSDSDKTTQTKCLKVHSDIKTKELSQEWQEPVNIWPNTESCYIPRFIKEPEKNIPCNIHMKNDLEFIKPETPKTFTLKRLEELQKAANTHFTEEQTDVEDFLKDCYSENLELKNTWEDRNVDFEWNKQCQDWSIQTEVVLNEEQAQDIWTQAPQIDVIDGLDYAQDINSEEWKEPGLFGDAAWTEGATEWSVDSEGEFQRGAHAAPHSSETELALPSCVNTLDVSFSSLSRLSSSQLLLAARQHSRVLRRLLQESDHRQVVEPCARFVRIATTILPANPAVKQQYLVLLCFGSEGRTVSEITT